MRRLPRQILEFTSSIKSGIDNRKHTFKRSPFLSRTYSPFFPIQLNLILFFLSLQLHLL
jgi:ABC-type phosphate/phosphonate transport system permease subunit